jgi:hypothetical protein
VGAIGTANGGGTAQQLVVVEHGKWWWYSTANGGGRARQMVVVQHSKWWSRASSIYMLEEALEQFSAANWIGGKGRSRLAPNRENLNRLDQILH